MWDIGCISSRGPGESAGVVAAFHRGLNETAFVEGRNRAIEYRWAEGQYDRLPALAADLVRRHVNVIVSAGGDPAAQAAKAATATIPIVFVTGSDPVKVPADLPVRNQPNWSWSSTSKPQRCSDSQYHRLCLRSPTR
jgi:hypothetical protein